MVHRQRAPVRVAPVETASLQRSAQGSKFGRRREILKRCIPGCEALEKTDANTMVATAAIKVGPVTAKFTGNVTLSDLDPPNGYRIEGEGQGGVAGFAQGGAVVRLEALSANETLLHYDVSAQVGRKLAQLGGRLIDATAKQLSSVFFKKFAEEVTAPAAVSAGQSPSDEASLKPRPTPNPAAARQTPAVAGDTRPGLSVAVGLGLVATLVALFLLVVALDRGAFTVGLASGAGFPATLTAILIGFGVAIGYLLGRLARSSAAPIVVIDQGLVREIVQAANARDR